MTCQHCQEDWCWLCGRHLGDDHYGGFSSCAGQQFGAASPFALWNLFPCLRWQCSAVLRHVLHWFIIFILGVIAFSFACVALPVSLALLPFSLLLVYFTGGTDTIALLYPSLFVMGFLCSAFLLALNLIYLPVPIVVTIMKILFSGCACRGVSYFPCQGDEDDDSEALYELWFYPLYLLKSYFPNDDD
jgi:hypothetical protein